MTTTAQNNCLAINFMVKDNNGKCYNSLNGFPFKYFESARRRANQYNRNAPNNAPHIVISVYTIEGNSLIP